MLEKSASVHERPRFMELGTLTTTVISEAAMTPLHSAGSQSGAFAANLVQNVLTALDDAKAEDVVSIELGGKTSIADTMVISTGRSNTHVGSIADRVLKACKAAGVSAPRVEGLPHCDWVLVDAGDVIIHVFRPEVRAFYNLEKMWGGDRPNEAENERRPV
jgi:ribosome-associated protein